MIRASAVASTSAPTRMRSPPTSTIEAEAVAVAIGVASTTLTGTMFTVLADAH